MSETEKEKKSETFHCSITSGAWRVFSFLPVACVRVSEGTLEFIGPFRRRKVVRTEQVLAVAGYLHRYLNIFPIFVVEFWLDDESLKGVWVAPIFWGSPRKILARFGWEVSGKDAFTASPPNCD